MPAMSVPFAANVFESVEFMISVGLLIATLLGGAVVIWFTDLWRKKRNKSEASDDAETLSLYRDMNRRGEISDAEYKAIRIRIAARMKEAAAGVVNNAVPDDFDDLKVVPPAVDSAESKND